MIRRIAIIPARGGSKRIPNKNIREFCGRPMVAYVLDAARSSGLFDKIHVSTDSNKIAKVVKSLGFPVDFMRPQFLADDHAPIMPVLKYVLEQYSIVNCAFDEVWLLMACSPNISDQHLLNASSLLQSLTPGLSLVSISEYPVPIEWAFSRSPSGKLQAIQPGMYTRRSQDFEARYYDTGTFAVFSSSTVLESSGANSNTQYAGYVLPKGTAIDIDTESDWAMAEALHKASGEER